MKCATHNADATALCVNCGAALCPACGTKSVSGRFVCSISCAEATTREELAHGLILDKATKGAKASAFFTFLLGGMFIVFAFLAMITGEWPLVLFLGVSGIGFIIGGFVYRRVGTTNTSQPIGPTIPVPRSGSPSGQP
jgi:hypothetical protein